MAKQFFQDYFNYVGETEAPTEYHRWSILSCMGAAIGRRGYLPVGQFKLYPAIYTLLIGGGGTRKGAAISLARKLLEGNKYATFAADRTTKEKLIQDLMDASKGIQLCTDASGEVKPSVIPKSAETFIITDEIQDFLGVNNLDFITLLGRLWEGKSNYETRVKHGKSAYIKEPCVNLLAGATPTGFGMTFPPELLGQGFMSKLILIYGEPTRRRLAFPKGGTRAKFKELSLPFYKALHRDKFQFSLTSEAKDIITALYDEEIKLTDPRFKGYEARRHEHLLRICCLVRCLSSRPDYKTITLEDVLIANTMLYSAECKMPMALGEFGKGKFAGTSNAIMEALHHSNVPLSLGDLWKMVAQDLSSQNDLVAILRGLQSIDKIQSIETDSQIKFLPKVTHPMKMKSEYIDTEALTHEEAVACGII